MKRLLIVLLCCILLPALSGCRRTPDKTAAGEEFTVYKYDIINENNPYASGISAFGVWERGAVSVEIILSDSFTDNADETLNSFLSGFHYA